MLSVQLACQASKTQWESNKLLGNYHGNSHVILSSHPHVDFHFILVFLLGETKLGVIQVYEFQSPGDLTIAT